MPRRIALFALLCLTGLGGTAIAAAAGALDSSFDDDGIAELPAPSKLFGAAVQGDGKLVAAGERGGSVVVVRFNADGSLDSSFNGDGEYDGPGGAGHGVAIDASGRILVAATTSQGMTAIRLGSDGVPDASFSGDGVAGASIAGSQGLDVAAQGGKVVVAGAAATASGNRLLVARWGSGGALDGSFAGGGAQSYGYGVAVANAVTIDGDGKIVLAGSQFVNGQLTFVLAARLDANGSGDASFGNIGGVPGLFVKDAQRSAGYSAAFDVTIDSSNRPVLAGVALNGLPSSADPTGSNAVALRLTTAGVLDTSFSDDGIAYLPAAQHKDQYSKPEPYPGAYGVTLGGSDVILAGYYDNLNQKQLAVWALTSSGAPDTAFGAGGHSFTSFSTTESAKLNGIAIAANGDLFGVGDIGALVGSYSNALAAKYGGVGAPPAPPGPTPGPGPGPGPGPDPGPGPGPGPEPSPPTCLGEDATRVGTSGPDTLRGTASRDVFVTFGGSDTVRSAGGNDLICSGSGDDEVFAGAGNDVVRAGGGNDEAFGQDGADEVSGEAGADRLFGGRGADDLFGGRGRDRLSGGPGSDTLQGGPGEDTTNQ